MESVSIGNGKEGVHLYSGMVLTDDDISALERIVSSSDDRITELEKNAPTPEGTRLNILEHSHDTLWKSQIEAKNILEKMRAEIALMSRKFDHDHKAHTRIYKEIDEHREDIDKIQERNFEETEADIKRDKRISDIEEFMEGL